MAAFIGVAILTLAFIAPQVLDFRRAPVAEGVVQTLIAVVGTLVAVLVIGRYRRSSQLSDLLIVLSVFLLAWVHTAFVVVPNLINPNSIGNGYSERVEIWGSSLTQIVAATYFLAATRTRAKSPSSRRRLRDFYIFLPMAIAGCAIVPSSYSLR